MKGYVKVLEWIASGASPWTLGTVREYARRAIARRPGYTHWPFRQVRPGGPIWVDPVRMEEIFSGRSNGKKK